MVDDIQSPPYVRSLFRVAPIPFESGRGFLLRATGVLEYSGIARINEVAGIETYALDTNEAMTRYAHFFRIEPTEIRRHFYYKVEGANARSYRSFFGQVISRTYLNMTSPRVCSVCLAETSVCYALWDLMLVTVCPIHKCELINRCPECEKPISWYRPRVHLCNCGFDLRCSERKFASHASIAIISLIKDIFLCEKVSQRQDEGTKYPPPLRWLQLGDLFRVIVFLGNAALSLSRGDSQPFRPGVTLQDSNQIVENAHAILLNWPHSLLSSLNQVRDRNLVGGSFHLKLSHAFGSFYRYLFKELSAPQFEFIREVFENFVDVEWGGQFRSGSRRFENSANTSRWVSASQAEKMVEGTPRKTFVRLVNDGTLRGVYKPQGKTAKSETWIERKSLEEWIKNEATMVPRSYAEKTLGVTGDAVMSLGRAGILKYKQNGMSGPWMAWSFVKYEVDCIEMAFTKFRSVPVISKPNEKYIFLRHAVVSLIGYEVGFPAVVRAVLDGRLIPVGRAKKLFGIFDYVFFKSDLVRFRPTSLEMSERNMVNSGEVARVLGLGKRIVAALLCDKRFFGHVRQERSERLMFETELDAFRHRYIFAAELSRKFETTAIRVSTYLSECGIPGFVLDIPNSGKTFLYEKSAIEGVEIPKSKHSSKTKK